MAKRKDILTTGQVAQICNVAPRTVTKWFDSGQLKGYRIPGSRDRRIPIAELVRFMKAHNIPTDSLEVGKIRILIIDDDREMASALADALNRQANYKAQTAQSNFDAGVIAHKFAPHVILVNLLAKSIDAAQICKNIRTNSDLQGTRVIAVAEQLNDTEIAALLKKGFDGFLSRPVEVDEVIKTIEEVTSIFS